MKDEEWGGAFVDHFEGTVPDKNIFRIVKGNKVAEDSYIGSERVTPSRGYTVTVIQAPAPPAQVGQGDEGGMY